MEKLYTVELTEPQIRLLISGLGWMSGEAGDSPIGDALYDQLYALVGPTEWERRVLLQEQDHDGYLPEQR